MDKQAAIPLAALEQARARLERAWREDRGFPPRGTGAQRVGRCVRRGWAETAGGPRGGADHRRWGGANLLRGERRRVIG